MIVRGRSCAATGVASRLRPLFGAAESCIPSLRAKPRGVCVFNSVAFEGTLGSARSFRQAQSTQGYKAQATAQATSRVTGSLEIHVDV